MSNCVMCGSPLPPDQGSKTCSMCYGDIDHGKDNYYRDFLDQTREIEDDHDYFEPVHEGLTQND